MTSLANNILNRRALGDIGNKLVVANNANTQFGVINKRVPLTTSTTTTTTAKQTQLQQQVEQEATAPQLKPQQQQPVINEPVKEVVVIESSSSNDISLNSTTGDEDIADIVDIDEGDYENTQLAADYVKDIYNYLYQMEVSVNFINIITF